MIHPDPGRTSASGAISVWPLSVGASLIWILILSAISGHRTIAAAQDGADSGFTADGDQNNDDIESPPSLTPLIDVREARTVKDGVG